MKKPTKQMTGAREACDASHLHGPACDFHKPKLAKRSHFLMILYPLPSVQTHIRKKRLKGFSALSQRLIFVCVCV